MTIRIGILIFDGAEELDFVGPWEVFTMARALSSNACEVLLIAEREEAVRCAKGMRVLPDVTLSECGTLDVILIPGGQGTRREVENKSLLAWIEQRSRTAKWITSVCTGALLLTAAGPAKGKNVTTHWNFVSTLRERGEAAQVLDNYRYVQDGNVVTAAGVSAGIDMALWLTGQLFDIPFARRVQRQMEYDPLPPYGGLTR
ncbi:MAG TPA: DJ-1/PfpI family protein [Rhizomicrobium sp.]|jgi:transcriptional regulator GlxA family with amidase domain|nr:DJ-1/PfpI family protein [Rhizomicrobium sp.]